MTITRREEFLTTDLNDIDYESTFVNLEPGKLVKGIVVLTTNKEALIDVGGKSEGVLPIHEISNTPIGSINEVINEGEEVELYVLREENEDGQVTLSKRRVDFAKGWSQAQEDFDNNKIVKGVVIDVVKGGLLINIHKIRGFVPASQLRIQVDSLDELKGEELTLKIIEVNQKKNKLILSHRKALEDERSSLRTEVVNNLSEGDVITGRIVRLVDFGAFIDVGGIDGLLPISEISWKRISHPSEILKANEKITVKVFKIDRELNRVSLSYKRMHEDPWEKITLTLKEGQQIDGKVSKIANYGVFVEIQEGVEALLPANEINSDGRSFEEMFPIGSDVSAFIKKFKPNERKLSLSLSEPVAEESSDAEAVEA